MAINANLGREGKRETKHAEERGKVKKKD